MCALVVGPSTTELPWVQMAHPFGYFLSLSLLRFPLFIHCEYIFIVFRKSVVTVAELKSLLISTSGFSQGQSSLILFSLSFPVSYF